MPWLPWIMDAMVAVDALVAVDAMDCMDGKARPRAGQTMVVAGSGWSNGDALLSSSNFKLQVATDNY